MPRRTYANAVLEEEETKMMDDTPKYSRFRGKRMLYWWKHYAPTS